MNLLLMAGVSALAADHLDGSPILDGFPAADIADVYAWKAGNKVNAVVTFGGFQSAAVFDANLTYTLHFTTIGEPTVDIHTIDVVFAQNDRGSWGVQATGIPGQGTLSGPVETVLSAKAKLWAGYADDPFFFDLEGFGNTLATSTLAFDNTRDAFAGANVTAIVVQFKADALSSSQVRVWASTHEVP